MKWHLTVIFIFNSNTINYVGHLSMSLLSFFENVCWSLLLIFKLGWSYFWLLIYRGPLYILDISPLTDTESDYLFPIWLTFSFSCFVFFVVVVFFNGCTCSINSQARDWIQATAAAMPDSLIHYTRLRIKLMPPQLPELLQ